MDTLDKLKLLGESAKYDVCASTATRGGKVKNAALGATRPAGVCHSFTPDGRCISLFKVLLSNHCEKDCAYCPNRADRDVRRARFAAEELAGLFIEFYRRNYVEGLFLSSGVFGSTSRTMGEILQVAELLRRKYRFGGYIHLKILPGATEAEISAAAALANRVSLNIEAPSAAHLARLSLTKNYEEDILSGMNRLHKVLDGRQDVTHSTQYIVGAAGETDQEILSSASGLYATRNLKRAYFSAFQPVDATPLDNAAATPLVRENRLYQSDFLLRLYGFRLEDLVFADSGNLYEDLDPKLAMALHRPDIFPLEINTAGYADLLKVPGIGPQSAAKVTAVRRRHRLYQPDELKNLGVVVKRALSFITINGRFFGSRPLLDKPQRPQYQQLSLWGDGHDQMLIGAGFHH